ncbi:MAG: transglutaminase-like domain-containing protein [Candidatus Woesearchaeota archaeon]
MRSQKYLFILFILLFIPLIYADWNLFSESVTVNVDLYGRITYNNPSDIESFEINLQYFPRNLTNQVLTKKNIFPLDNIRRQTDENLYFFFDQFFGNQIIYGVNSTITVFSDSIDIPNKINFPLVDVPDYVRDFLLPTKTADSDDPRIIELANELVQNEDDLYEVVVKIAEWVQNNVKYDLTTVTAEASLPASWVLVHRYGVCDEITNLFMALLRSQGIPVRYVSGISYTTADYLDSHWGPHGWSEVYFPGTGWVPFDVTYQQYGYVDPTHIILSHSKDSTDDSTLFRWKESGSSVNIEPIITETDLVSFEGNFDYKIYIDVKPYYESVGIGSYNLIELQVTNLRNSYIAPIFYISQIRDITNIDNNRKSVTLKPYQTKSFYWLIKISDFIDASATYNVPLVINSSFGPGATSNFQISPISFKYSRHDFQKILDSLAVNVVDDNVDFGCIKNDTREIYEGMDFVIICDVINNEDFLINDFRLCFSEICKTFSLEPGSSYRDRFLIESPLSGVHIAPFILHYNNVSRTSIINTLVKDDPMIELLNISYPENVFYDEIINIEFLLSRKSNSAPREINVILMNDYFNEVLFIDEFVNDQSIVFRLNSKILDSGENQINFYLNYEDELGNSYRESYLINMELVGLSIWQKTILSFRKFYRYTVSIFA